MKESLRCVHHPKAETQSWHPEFLDNALRFLGIKIGVKKLVIDTVREAHCAP